MELRPGGLLLTNAGTNPRGKHPRLEKQLLEPWGWGGGAVPVALCVCPERELQPEQELQLEQEFQPEQEGVEDGWEGAPAHLLLWSSPSISPLAVPLVLG